MEALLEGESEALTRKAVELAKAGDQAALRLCFDRLPKINAAADLIAAASALTEAAASGEITPGEAASLSTLVGNVAKAVKTAELAERIAKLEDAQASR